MTRRTRRKLPIEPSVEGEPRLCPCCRLVMQPAATVCPHCRSDFGTHPFWSRTGVYVPALSLVAAIVGMSPTLIDAVSKARNPPVAEVVVTEAHVDKPGLNLDLANFGSAMGVLQSTASCRLLPTEDEVRLDFSAERRLSMPASSTAAVAFEQSALIRVLLPEGEDWSVNAQLLPLAEAFTVFETAAIEGVEEEIGRRIPLPQSRFELDCSIGVDGINNPKPITMRFEFKRGENADTDPAKTMIRWTLESANP